MKYDFSIPDTEKCVLVPKCHKNPSVAAADSDLVRLFDRPAEFQFERTADLMARHVLESLPAHEVVSARRLVEAVRDALINHDITYWDGTGLGGVIKKLPPEARLVSWGNQVAIRLGVL